MVAGLEVTVDSPKLILKDRPYLPGRIEIDLGNIAITNDTK